MSCFGCPILLVLPWLSFPSSPVVVALSWRSCPGRPDRVILFCLSFSACPVPVLSWLSYNWQSCSVCLVLPVQCCLTSFACLVLPFLFYLSCSACLLMPVLYCLCFTACPVQPILVSLFSFGCSVLGAFFCITCPGSPLLAIDTHIHIQNWTGRTGQEYIYIYTRPSAKVTSPK
jgi:hypothetical protein